MSKTRIGISIITKRIVEETWEFDILDDEDPQTVFNEIKANPSSLFIDRDCTLVYSDDIDDETTDVICWEFVK